jgi:sugar phosphate isomerase/epimerase
MKTVLALGVLLFVGTGVAGEGAPAKGLSNPFFPFCVTVPEAKLQELGFAPVKAVWPAIHLDKDPVYGPDLPEQIKKLKGTDTVLWIIVHGSKAKDNDEKAVKAIRELAAVAEENGVRFSLYPHTGDYVTVTRDALRIAKLVDRKNVGVTLNLCHELKNDTGDDLPKIIEEAAPLLYCITICGADIKPKGENMGWDRLIRPLGQGTFDVYAFLKKVKAAGFKGPIGLQCYGLPGAMGGKPGDALEHLAQSSKAWKEYCAKMAAE